MEVVAMFKTFATSQYAPKTADLYYRAVVRFLAETGKPLHQITENDVAAWLDQFPFRSSAKRTYYHGLDLFFHWAGRNRHTNEGIMRYIRPAPVAMKAPQALSKSEVNAILAAAQRRHPTRAAAIAFLYYTGCRLNEMMNVQWSDFQAGGILLRKTKNGRERLQPWSDGLREATEILRHYFGEDEHMIPRTHQTVWGWCATAGNEAGVEMKVHPHLFRSTAATEMMRNGAAVHTVKAFLGHDNIRTTSRYLADNEEDKAAAAALLDLGGPKRAAPPLHVVPDVVG